MLRNTVETNRSSKRQQSLVYIVGWRILFGVLLLSILALSYLTTPITPALAKPVPPHRVIKPVPPHRVMKPVPQQVIAVGQSPVSVAVNVVTNRVYVANSVSGTVSVIDGASQKVLATVTVDPFPVSIAVNPTLNRYYVVSQERGTVSVMSGVDNSVIRVDQTGPQSSAVVVDPLTNNAYVASRNQIAIVDSADSGTQSFIPLPFDGQSAQLGMAINPQAHRLYVSDSIDSKIAIIDTAQQSVIGGIQLAANSAPFALAVDARQGKLYVANFVLDQILAYDSQGAHLQRIRSAGSHPIGLAIGAAGRLYVSEGGGFGLYFPTGLSKSVATLAGATLSPLRRVAVSCSPTGIAVNASSGRVFVTCSHTDSLLVLPA